MEIQTRFFFQDLANQIRTNYMFINRPWSQEVWQYSSSRFACVKHWRRWMLSKHAECRNIVNASHWQTGKKDQRIRQDTRTCQAQHTFHHFHSETKIHSVNSLEWLLHRKQASRLSATRKSRVRVYRVTADACLLKREFYLAKRNWTVDSIPAWTALTLLRCDAWSALMMASIANRTLTVRSTPPINTRTVVGPNAGATVETA